MEFHIMTLFPEMVETVLGESILGRAESNGKISTKCWNIRDYAQNRYKHVDDYIYGGGPGMLMQADPIYRCYKDILADLNERGISAEARVIYMSPKGCTFTQRRAEALAHSPETPIIILCGHYEGVDERALQLLHAEELSIGDYILTGGELAACVVVDAIARLLPGVLGDDESSVVETFYDDLLECPQYTRPETYEGLTVPEILLSGNHAKIAAWRREQSEMITRERRPDLFARYMEKGQEKS